LTAVVEGPTVTAFPAPDAVRMPGAISSFLHATPVRVTNAKSTKVRRFIPGSFAAVKIGKKRLTL